MPATDNFAERNAAVDQSARDASNGGVGALSKVTTGVYVGGTGTLVVTMASGNEAIFYDVPAGTFLPIQISEVLSAAAGSPSVSTTVTKLTFLYAE